MTAEAHPATPKQYDPVKVVEGMFAGSIMCIAQALQGGRESIKQTKTVLAECSKKFQDSLDDCEIQILDAKWYLESRLADNKARREAEVKAQQRAASNGTKRKSEEGDDVLLTGSPKRAKSNEPSSPIAMDVVSEQQNASKQPAVGQMQQETEETISKEAVKPDTKAEDKEDGKSDTAVDDLKTEPQPIPDDIQGGSAQATPSLNADDYIFESMFGEPTDGNENAQDSQDDDVNMNFNFEEQFNAVDTEEKESEQKTTGDKKTQLQSEEMSRSQNVSQNLTSLLPDLEAFGNQADDTGGMDFTMDGTGNLNNSADGIQNETNMFTEDFGPNIFDEAFEDGAFGSMDDVGEIDDPGKSDLNFDDFAFT